MCFSPRNWQADLKIHMKMDGTQNNKNNLEKERSKEHMTPDFKAQ